MNNTLKALKRNPLTMQHFLLALFFGLALTVSTASANADTSKTGDEPVPHILIFVVADDEEGPSTTSAQFETQQACEAAAAALEERHDTWSQDAYGDCFPVR